jgi:HD-GYP domain-containing protein (c-di-GMP phosphodiesterase class II)
MNDTYIQPIDDPKLRQTLKQIEDRYREEAMALASALVSVVDRRDAYTGSHSNRVAAYARDISLRLGLPESHADQIALAGLLHDIGKVGVPDDVLLKRQKLSERDFSVVHRHAELGWSALRKMDDFKAISLLVLHHHEKMDGRGYPAGLKGNAIPLGSRIIAVADSFDALTTDRPYREAFSPQAAVDEILSCVETQFDSRVVAAFLDSLEQGSALTLA